MIEGRKAILSKMLISDRTWRGQAIKYKINGNPKAK